MNLFWSKTTNLYLMGILLKLFGGFIAFIGLVITIFYPWSEDYQPPEAQLAGIVLGLVLFGIGLLLIKL